jgi:hypothetical protein
VSCLLIKCCKYFVLCLLYITDTTPWQAICISTTLKYNRSLEKHVLAHFQRTTCSQIYFRFSSYLLCKPLLIRSTAFICNIDRDWMIYRKHPIRSLLTSMLRKANIRYLSDIYALSFEKYKGKKLRGISQRQKCIVNVHDCIIINSVKVRSECGKFAYTAICMCNVNTLIW